jgi:hypothetical protein
VDAGEVGSQVLAAGLVDEVAMDVVFESARGARVLAIMESTP